MTGERFILQRRALNNAWRWVDVMSSDSLSECVAQARGGMRIYDTITRKRAKVDAINKQGKAFWSRARYYKERTT